MDDRWFERRFQPLKWLTFLGVAGAASVLTGLLTAGDLTGWTLKIGGALLILPVFFYLWVLPIWHWKERYLGTHSDLWGVLLVLETSGLFKIVYWFRHILADWQGNSRYRHRPEVQNEHVRTAV